MVFSDQIKTTKYASSKLTGHRHRDFMAKVAKDYFDSSARKTETFLGWTVKVFN